MKQFTIILMRAGKRSSHHVESIAAAAGARQTLGEWDGATAYYKCRDAGDVLDAAGKRVAHVSYNGRVWCADRKTSFAGGVS